MIKRITVFLLALLLLPTFSAFASSASISADMEYIVLSPGKDASTLITDMVSFKNLTAEEYKGDGQTEGVLNILFPEGATGFSMMDGKIKYKETDTGFITLDPIPAKGSITLPFSYQLKQGQDIGIKFSYPVDLYQVLIPEGSGSVDIKDAEFSYQGILDFDNQKYAAYTIQNIKAGQTVTMAYDKDKQPAGTTATGTDTTSTENKNLGDVTKSAPAFHNPGHLRMWAQSPLHKFNPHILMIVLGAILLAGIGYYSYFKMKNRVKSDANGADKEEQVFKQLMAKQKAILDKIIELEDNLGNGQMTEDEYKTKLEAYKQHLVQVKLSLRQFVE